MRKLGDGVDLGPVRTYAYAGNCRPEPIGQLTAKGRMYR